MPVGSAVCSRAWTQSNRHCSWDMRFPCQLSSVRGTTMGYFTAPWDTSRARNWRRKLMPTLLISLASVRGRGTATKPLLECGCTNSMALPSMEWTHSRGGQTGAQARRSGCVDEGAREGDGRVNEREGEHTTVECQRNFRAPHDDRVSSPFVQPPDLGGQGVDDPEGNRCGLCLDTIACVVDGVADPALALLVGFEEAVMAVQID